MTRQEIIRELLQQYQTERFARERERDEREAEAEKRDPVLARLREESADVMLNAVRRMKSGMTREEAAAVALAMREDGQRLSQERAERLRRMGYPEDYLSVRYACPLCKDTGYVGEVSQSFCPCFEKKLAARLYEDGSLSGGEKQSFETYDEGVYPEANGQRRQALRARDFCRDFADAFPDNEKRQLVLTGTGGLGKTYLLNCIYERVTSRGCAAVRLTAYRLGEIMRSAHLQEDDGAFRDLVKTPMLLIDDLGTEPMLRNITIEYLFSLINERVGARLHTVIATNLTPVQLAERYGERITSRLLDRRNSSVILLTGRDVRLA